MDPWHSILDVLWLCVLLLMLRHFRQERKAIKASQEWLLTKGRITLFNWTRAGHRLWPKIEYRYEVNGREYTGEYLFLDTSHNSPHSRYARKVAYRVAMAYEKNEDIDVFYNPNDPGQAALDIAMPKKLTFIIGLLVFLIVLHLVIVGYRWLIASSG
ncbi:DUF3592 domain-containing protein [Legionella spiritensis]|uniref:DUF3592 domain-containing protein n=1 Tax=Legionella spiritensis TaxID=452 RepID=A0A0W0YZD1_LEGSP|nr:DUF3592 domain-containing protein [Legionella spiritensis]KTD62241.1 hypothetical protein Lspi_2091 [Legionella spiritensis]SNV29000.1 Protein of uncharacterised function (DUF3592) [Legionella spiritensis]